MAVIASKATGTSASIDIYDDGYGVNAYLYNTSAPTNFSNKGWSMTINGKTVTGTFSVNGAGTYIIYGEGVTTSQTVTVSIAATGTIGVGGPTTVSVWVNRATVPPAPTKPTVSSITSTGMKVTFSSRGTGGSAVTEWQLQRARNSSFTTSASVIASSGTTTYTDMAEGQTWYFRARGKNAIGWGAWSAVGNGTTLAKPAKPVVPTLFVLTSSSIELKTTDPANGGAAISAREIVLSKSSTFTSIESTKTTPSPSFLAADGVTRNQAYYVKWRVQNSVGWSEWSDTLSVTAPGSPPSAPANYTVYEISGNSAMVSLGTLSDNGGAQPSRVRVKVSTTASDVGWIETVTSLQWAPVRLTSLSKGTSYFVAEAAFNTAVEGGWGEYGAWVPFTTKSNVPNAPTLSLDAATATTATLEWLAPTELNGATILNYGLRTAADPALVSNVRNFTIPATDVSRIIDQLVEGGLYYATIWTESSQGRGSSSPVLQFQTVGGGAGGTPFWININGVEKKVSAVWININGVNKLVTTSWLNVNGVWKTGS